MVTNNFFVLRQKVAHPVVFRTGVLLSLSMLLLSLVGRPLYAQSASTGALAGTVRDSSGAVVAGASVRIVNVGTSESRELLTDEHGGYAVGFLPPGQYRIEFSQAGFKSVVREG